MASAGVNYQSLDCEDEPNPQNEDNFHEDGHDTPQSSGVMIHIVPDGTNKARWSHLEDLDSFFIRVYNYHQKHGFTVIFLEEMFQLLEFAFVAWLLTFTVHCVKYPVLFGEQPPASNNTKVSISDVVKSTDECLDSFGATTILLLLLATLYFMVRLVKFVFQMTQYWDIKKFYNTALHIEDEQLDNLTWHQIKLKIRQVQAELHMCIDKESLSDLDIYHRILRFKNYMVALMNKNLLPVSYELPLLGKVCTLSRGLMYNIEIILFRSPGSPFQNNWQLRDDYTVRSNQIELAQRLSKLIFWIAVANLVLAPVIFIWQIIYFAFAYVSVLRKEPGALGMRTWSNYGRLYLRHFNELEHELEGRLNRAYEFSNRYVGSFSSPVMAAVSKNILFISGGVLIVILTLGIYDEFVFQVEHVLTIITVLTVIGLTCRTLIPDENMIWCPEHLMTAILAHVHYLPPEWKNQAHTTVVRDEFGKLFQFKAAYLLNEIISPLTTPFVLLFVFRPKSLEVVKFFRSFTVTVRGVGNVCSFAQMDVRKHGDPEWQLHTEPVNDSQLPAEEAAAAREDSNKQPMENGKTELSLVRFTLTNPDWQMPKEAKNFIRDIRENAVKDLIEVKSSNAMQNSTTNNCLTESLIGFGNMGRDYASIANSILAVSPRLHESLIHNANIRREAAQESDFEQMLQQNLGELSQGDNFNSMAYSSINTLDNFRKRRAYKLEGRLEGPTDSLIYSLDPTVTPLTTDITVADMCLQTLFLHEVHKQNRSKMQRTAAASGGGGGGGSTNTTKSSLEPKRSQFHGARTKETTSSMEPGSSRQRTTVLNMPAATGSASTANEDTPLLRNLNT